MKECPPSKILHPLTYNCVNKSGRVGKRILNGEFEGKNIICACGKILNPITKKCVKKSGKIGKRILLGEEKKVIFAPHKSDINRQLLAPYKKKVPFQKTWMGESIYGYLSLVYLMKNNEKDCIVLVPPAINKSYHENWEDWELLWSNEIGKKKSHKLLMPKKFKKIFKNCIKNPNINFILMNIGIEVRKNREFQKGHENFLIIDKTNKTAEHFEPHGYILSEKNYNLPKLYKKLKMMFNEIGYKYLSPKKCCPRIGFQYIEERYKKSIEDVGGYCAIWSYFYADIRMKNPNIPPLVLSKMIKKELYFKPKYFRKFIRNYTQFLIREIDTLSNEIDVRKYITEQLIKYAE